MIILPYPLYCHNQLSMKQYAAFPVGKVPIHLKADFPFPASGFRLPFLFPLPVIMFEMIAFYYIKYKIHQRNGKQSGFPAYGGKTLFKNDPAFLHAVPVQHVIEAQQPQKSHNCIYGYRPHHFYFFFPSRIFPPFQKSGEERWNTRQAQ